MKPPRKTGILFTKLITVSRNATFKQLSKISLQWGFARFLSHNDLYPNHVQDAFDISLGAEIYQDCIPSGRKAIGTHSNMFHSDDALAVSMLHCLPQYRNHVIVRTRDRNIINNCDIVVDVGGLYDHSLKRYDHHQQSFRETFDADHTTKLSSAGLVFKHYGQEIIHALSSVSLDSVTLHRVRQKLYSSIIEEVDGVDNGIEPYIGTTNYTISTSLSKRISRLAIPWNEPYSIEEEINRFRLAMGLMLGEFADCLFRQVNILLPARHLVEEAMDRSSFIHPSRSILLFEKECPFMEHVYEIEEEREEVGRVKFAIMPTKDGNWRIRSVNQQGSSFSLRKPLLPLYGGLRDLELQRACGIIGSVFVHKSGFMGITKTKEGAIEMAIRSL